MRFDPFFDEIDGRDALLLIGNDWNGGVIENAEEVLVAFDGNTRTRRVDLGDTSRWSNLWASVELGLDHIRTGPDHWRAPSSTPPVTAPGAATGS